MAEALSCQVSQPATSSESGPNSLPTTTEEGKEHHEAYGRRYNYIPASPKKGAYGGFTAEDIFGGCGA